MSPRPVLLVEDDEELAEIVTVNLADHGFTVSRAGSVAEARHALATRSFALLVCDLTLPDGDGLDLCREVFDGKEGPPVLILTARTSESDRVLGLDLGADDYLTKPFSVRELVARAKAILRRSGRAAPAPAAPITLHGLHLDPARRVAEVDGESVTLTATEFDLLHYLARHPGVVFSRLQLLRDVWGYGHDGYEHTVNSHINRLRAKVERDPANPRYVRTVWGVGYKFPDERDWAG